MLASILIITLQMCKILGSLNNINKYKHYAKIKFPKKSFSINIV